MASLTVTRVARSNLTGDPIADVAAKYLISSQSVFYLAFIYNGHEQKEAACLTFESHEEYANAEHAAAAFHTLPEKVVDFSILALNGRIPTDFIRQYAERRKARRR